MDFSNNRGCYSQSYNGLSGRQQIHNPVSHRIPDDGSLRRVADLPEQYQSAFNEFEYFNHIQSQTMDDLLLTDFPIVVSAPTGSGKTVLFELAIVRLLEKWSKNGHQESHQKIVYMAPVKALCSERLHDWEEKFSRLGLRTIEVTGDSDDKNLMAIQNFNLVLTTPEKWDSLTRKWRDHSSLVSVIKLFLIDEVHLVNEDKRGPTLEAVVSRMKTVQCSLSANQPELIRFIAVSATIPNVEDVAEWLGSKENPTKYYRFGEEMRPVHLKRIVKSYPFKGNMSSYKFDLNLSYKLKHIILEHAEGKPTLVFCSTRKGVIQTSNILLHSITFHFTPEQKMVLQEATEALLDNKLRDIVKYGVGYHHAGLQVSDRHSIEQLFRSGFLPILVCTSTLAMGVNLPAHLVVIKSTEQYVQGSWEEYPEGQILQMIGRAGRPQFDSSATAIILTKESMKEKYERLVVGKETVESSLHKNLAEHLNAEIVLGTVTDIAVALAWLRSTFFYVRAKSNPRHYGIPSTNNEPELEAKLQAMCMRELNGLEKYNLIKKTDFAYNVEPTASGKLMATYYLAFETMKIFMKVEGTEKLADIVDVISHCHEFADLQLRMSERSTLNQLNQNRDRETIRFSIQGRIKTKQAKVNCLIQAVLGCLQIADPSLSQEANRILRIAERLLRGLSLYLWESSGYEALASTLTLAKCCQVRMWENSEQVARQLPGIGPALASLLASAHKSTFQAIIDSNPRDLERIINRHPPMGNIIQEAARRMPKYSVEVSYEETFRRLFVKLTLDNCHDIYDATHSVSLLVAGDNNLLLLRQRVSDLVLKENGGLFTVTTNIDPDVDVKTVIAHLISNTIAGIDVKEVLVLSSKIRCMKPFQTPMDNYLHRKNPSGPTKCIPNTLNRGASVTGKVGGNRKNNLTYSCKQKKRIENSMYQTNLSQFAFKPPPKLKISEAQSNYDPETEVSSSQDVHQTQRNVFLGSTNASLNNNCEMYPNVQNEQYNAHSLSEEDTEPTEENLSEEICNITSCNSPTVFMFSGKQNEFRNVSGKSLQDKVPHSTPRRNVSSKISIHSQVQANNTNLTDNNCIQRPNIVQDRNSEPKMYSVCNVINASNKSFGCADFGNNKATISKSIYDEGNNTTRTLNTVQGRNIEMKNYFQYNTNNSCAIEKNSNNFVDTDSAYSTATSSGKNKYSEVNNSKQVPSIAQCRNIVTQNLLRNECVIDDSIGFIREATDSASSTDNRSKTNIFEKSNNSLLVPNTSEDRKMGSHDKYFGNTDSAYSLVNTSKSHTYNDSNSTPARSIILHRNMETQSMMSYNKKDLSPSNSLGITNLSDTSERHIYSETNNNIPISNTSQGMKMHNYFGNIKSDPYSNNSFENSNPVYNPTNNFQSHIYIENNNIIPGSNILRGNHIEMKNNLGYNTNDSRAMGKISSKTIGDNNKSYDINNFSLSHLYTKHNNNIKVSNIVQRESIETKNYSECNKDNVCAIGESPSNSFKDIDASYTTASSSKTNYLNNGRQRINRFPVKTSPDIIKMSNDKSSNNLHVAEIKSRKMCPIFMPLTNNDNQKTDNSEILRLAEEGSAKISESVDNLVLQQTDETCSPTIIKSRGEIVTDRNVQNNISLPEDVRIPHTEENDMASKTVKAVPDQVQSVIEDGELEKKAENNGREGSEDSYGSFFEGIDSNSEKLDSERTVEADGVKVTKNGIDGIGRNVTSHPTNKEDNLSFTEMDDIFFVSSGEENNDNNKSISLTDEEIHKGRTNVQWERTDIHSSVSTPPNTPTKSIRASEEDVCPQQDINKYKDTTKNDPNSNVWKTSFENERFIHDKNMMRLKKELSEQALEEKGKMNETFGHLRNTFDSGSFSRNSKSQETLEQEFVTHKNVKRDNYFPFNWKNPSCGFDSDSCKVSIRQMSDNENEVSKFSDTDDEWEQKTLRSEYGDPFAPIHDSYSMKKLVEKYEKAKCQNEKPNFHALNAYTSDHYQNQGCSRSNKNYKQQKTKTQKSEYFKNDLQKNMPSFQKFMGPISNDVAIKRGTISCGSMKDHFPVLKNVSNGRELFLACQTGSNAQGPASPSVGVGEMCSQWPKASSQNQQSISCETAERNSYETLMKKQCINFVNNPADENFKAFKRSMSIQNGVQPKKRKYPRRVRTGVAESPCTRLVSLVAPSGIIRPYSSQATLATVCRVSPPPDQTCASPRMSPNGVSSSQQFWNQFIMQERRNFLPRDQMVPTPHFAEEDSPQEDVDSTMVFPQNDCWMEDVSSSPPLSGDCFDAMMRSREREDFSETEVMVQGSIFNFH